MVYSTLHAILSYRKLRLFCMTQDDYVEYSIRMKGNLSRTIGNFKERRANFNIKYILQVLKFYFIYFQRWWGGAEEG